MAPMGFVDGMMIPHVAWHCVLSLVWFLASFVLITFFLYSALFSSRFVCACVPASCVCCCVGARYKNISTRLFMTAAFSTLLHHVFDETNAGTGAKDRIGKGKERKGKENSFNWLDRALAGLLFFNHKKNQLF